MQEAPSSARESFLYAMSWENQLNLDDTIKYLRPAIAFESSNARFHCHLGAAAREKKFGAAAEELETSIRLPSSLAPALYKLNRGTPDLARFSAPEIPWWNLSPSKHANLQIERSWASDASKQLQTHDQQRDENMCGRSDHG